MHALCHTLFRSLAPHHPFHAISRPLATQLICGIVISLDLLRASWRHVDSYPSRHGQILDRAPEDLWTAHGAVRRIL